MVTENLPESPGPSPDRHGRANRSSSNGRSRQSIESSGLGGGRQQRGRSQATRPLEDRVAAGTSSRRRQEAEVKSLRHRLAEQEHLLMERERAIEQLEREKVEMEYGPSDGGDRWITDCVCCHYSHDNEHTVRSRGRSRSLSTRRGRDSTSGRRRKACGWRVGWIECIQFLLVATVGVHYWLSFGSMDTMGASTQKRGPRPRNSAAQRRHVNEMNARLPKVRDRKPKEDNPLLTNVSPFTSHPPERIELFQTKSKAIKARHQCIEKIRERQSRELGPLIEKSSVDGRVLLVDPAYHKNVGDHMITLGELEFLRRMGLSGDSVVGQCRYKQAGKFVKYCDEYLSEQDPQKVARQSALWHGGGNWGDLWRRAQDARLSSFAPLLQKNYRIVGMPQSLFYQKQEMAEADATALKVQLLQGLGQSENEIDAPTRSWLDTDEGRKKAKSRVTLTWREAESYEEAQKLYPFVDNKIVPDIAFQLGPYERVPPVTGSAIDLDILFFLRMDRESVVAEHRDKKVIRKLVESFPEGKGLQFMIVDWVDRLEMFESEDVYFTKTSVQLLSLGRVVICDRLHTAILCYITGIPFVYVDQVSGKISKTLSVAFKSWESCKDGETAMWARAESLEDATRLALDFIRKYKLGTTLQPRSVAHASPSGK